MKKLLQWAKNTKRAKGNFNPFGRFVPFDSFSAVGRSAFGRGSSQRGFTIVELLVVMGIIGVLFSMTTINLLRTQHTASVNATVDQLVSDLHVQQTKAMTGTKDTTGSANYYGVHMNSNTYALFQGSTDPGDSTDFTVSPEGITFSTNLPNSMIVFARRSGEFSNYVSGTYTITVKNSYGTEQKVITLNKYGVVTGVQ